MFSSKTILAVIGAVGLVVPAAAQSSATRTTATYQRVKSYLNSIPAIDTHDHLWPFDILPGYVETDRGVIQIELAVLDAPLTVENFVTLARAKFFNGLSVHRVVPGFVVQAGDPRGDGEGGPGYTIRDELNQRPFLRGTVGIALDWADTGGSQFFIAQSPQPQLDAKYTVLGRVIAGMDVIDAIQRGDVIRDVRVWDGQN